VSKPAGQARPLAAADGRRWRSRDVIPQGPRWH